MASVHFLCKQCDARVAREAGEPARACESCGAANDVVAPDANAIIDRCAACGHAELYFQKDFNRTTGIALVVVGSKGGAPRHPGWYLNLVAQPEVEAQVGRVHRRLRARRATPEEAARLWPVIVACWPGYARYQAKTSREIPLVLLEPASQA